MELEDYFDISDDPKAFRIKGHRIWIEHVVHEYNNNYSSPEDIALRFPGLSLEKIYATLTYYLRHKAEIDADIADLDREFEEQRRKQWENPTPAMLRIRALREQWEREGRLPLGRES